MARSAIGIAVCVFPGFICIYMYTYIYKGEVYTHTHHMVQYIKEREKFNNKNIGSLTANSMPRAHGDFSIMRMLIALHLLSEKCQEMLIYNGRGR